MTTEHMAIDRSSSFRRRRFVASHRKRSSILLLVRPLATALFLVSLPALAVYWLSVTSRFDLDRIEISGAQQVSEQELRTVLDPLRGRHLLFLSLDDVETAVRQSRWVEGAAIRKKLPDALTVEIHERQPVALLRSQGDLYYVDRSGYPIEPYSPHGPVDLPLLSASAEGTAHVAAALQVADRFERVAPDWGSALSEIEILSEEDFRLHTGELEFPVLLSAATVETQVENLRSILPQIKKRYPIPVVVDLRFDRQIVIQPAVQPRDEKG